jgi:hypothetical protein
MRRQRGIQSLSPAALIRQERFTLKADQLVVGPSQTYQLNGQNCRATVNVTALNLASSGTVYGLDFVGAPMTSNGSGMTWTDNTFSGAPGNCYMTNSGLTGTMQWNTYTGGRTCGSGNFRANVTNALWTHEWVHTNGAQGMPITPGNSSVASNWTISFMRFDGVNNTSDNFDTEYAEDNGPSTNTGIRFLDSLWETNDFGPSIVSAGQVAT